MAAEDLSKDGVLLPTMDPEQEHYLLLAFVQRISESFSGKRLYPHLHELRDRMEAMHRLRNEYTTMQRDLSKELIGIDLANARLLFAQCPNDGLHLLDEVIGQSLPELERWLDAGESLRLELMRHIEFSPVGILPLETREGYLFLRKGTEARIYTYSIPLLREVKDDRQYRSVVTRYVSSHTMGWTKNYEQVKTDLLKGRTDRPVPASFLFETDIELPQIETYMPLAKQLIYKYLKTEHGL